MQDWDAWGSSWGSSWGYSWGFSKQPQGGGPGRSRKGKGWANERAAFEQSLRQAQTTLRKTQKPEAVKLAQKINAYEVGTIDLDALRVENAQLQARLQVKQEHEAEMQAAQQAIQAYIEDEQDAIDALMLSVAMDQDLILRSFAN